MTTHLVVPDPHAHPDFPNDRADWLGCLIADLKPDVVINLGDAADMPSLASYDKGKRSFHGKTYARDINAHLDFQERMWAPMKKLKKKMPRSIVFEGNHEERIERALDSAPELEGSVSFDDLDYRTYYDDIVRYDGQTPGILAVDGIHYAHYFITGVSGRNVSGEHPAYSLLTKEFDSCTCGHIHVLDFAERTKANGRKVYGLVAGVYQDYNADWAGKINDLWWRGVVIKRGVEDGCYDPEFVSLKRLKEIYGNVR